MTRSIAIIGLFLGRRGTGVLAQTKGPTAGAGRCGHDRPMGVAIHSLHQRLSLSFPAPHITTPILTFCAVR